MKPTFPYRSTHWRRLALLGLLGLLGLMGLLGPVATAAAQMRVVDDASISQTVLQHAEMLAKWKAQYDQLDSQLRQAAQQYQAVTGSRGMGALANGVAADGGLPTDWQAAMSAIRSTPGYAAERGRYPTDPKYPKANALYDTLAAQRAGMREFFAKAGERVRQVQQLRAQIDNAFDPAAKSDLANRLASEQNAIAANHQVFAALQDKQRQDIQDAGAAAAAEWRCKEFRSTRC